MSNEYVCLDIRLGRSFGSFTVPSLSIHVPCWKWTCKRRSDRVLFAIDGNNRVAESLFP